jgi:hypothetical protein
LFFVWIFWCTTMMCVAMNGGSYLQEVWDWTIHTLTQQHGYLADHGTRFVGLRIWQSKYRILNRYRDHERYPCRYRYLYWLWLW